MKKHIPGKGCQCAAKSEWECCCDVDWRSTREVELEAENKQLREALGEMRRVTESFEYMESQEMFEVLDLVRSQLKQALGVK